MPRASADFPWEPRWEELSRALEEGSARAADEARVALISALDEEDTNFAQEAQFLLERFPDGVIEPLLREAPRFGRFGSLCAIELFQHLEAREAEPVLIGMLENEDGTVREWAAAALAELGSAQAVPALQRAYERWRRSGEPPNWSEPLSIRRALTALGAREEALPDEAARRACSDRFGLYWRIADAEQVFNALARADQVVTDIGARERSEKGWYLVTDASLTYELDYSLPWEQLVHAAREEALSACDRIPARARFVTVNWIDKADL